MHKNEALVLKTLKLGTQLKFSCIFAELYLMLDSCGLYGLIKLLLRDIISGS